MKTYTLYRCSKSGRMIISGTRPNYRVRSIRKVEAASWKEAKQLFGYGQ